MEGFATVYMHTPSTQSSPLPVRCIVKVSPENTVSIRGLFSGLDFKLEEIPDNGKALNMWNKGPKGDVHIKLRHLSELDCIIGEAEQKINENQTTLAKFCFYRSENVLSKLPNLWTLDMDRWEGFI